MQSFKKLKVWEKAHKLALDVYAGTSCFPRTEAFGLTSQVRRAACSIGANIAEGCCRKGDLELGRFLQIAMGSASELEYHLLLAGDLEFLDSGAYRKLDEETVEVKKMLAAFINRLKADS